jgi:anti-sigma B factor antagonist
MKVNDRVDGDIVVIEFAGKVIPGEDITAFHRKIRLHLDRHHKSFVIDMGQVEWISSAGLGALIGAYASVRKAEGKLVLANAKSVQSLLHLTRLTEVFEIYDSCDEAKQSFGS